MSAAQTASNEDSGTDLSPFVEIKRADWAELGNNTELPLTESEIAQIRGLGDFLDIKEVTDVYLPLSRLLNLYVAETQDLHRVTSGFLGERSKRVWRRRGVSHPCRPSTRRS